MDKEGNDKVFFNCAVSKDCGKRVKSWHDDRLPLLLILWTSDDAGVVRVKVGESNVSP